MLSFVGHLEGGDNELAEAWFMVAKDERLELLNLINKLNKAYLSAEELAAMDEAQPFIDEAGRRYGEDKTNDKIHFITWINETYVPEAKRQPIPGPETTSVNKKFARWYVGKISKHIHPDNFVSAPLAKQKEMQEISSLNNKIVNKLKGHA